MRNIKFRFWDKKQGKMFERVTMIALQWECEEDPPVYVGNNEFNYGNGTVPHYSDGHLMQFTGLHDKNGKEIYEGDILKTIALSNDHNQRGAITKSPIEYFHGNVCLSITHVPLYPFCINHDIEIIGNIYENPELLGESK